MVVNRLGYSYNFSFSAETFGAERRPIVEFALEDVEKVRLQKIRKERQQKSAESAQGQQNPSGDQPASDGRHADSSRTFRKGNKRKSHDRPSKPSDSGEGPAKDPSVAGDRSSVEVIRKGRPAKRSRKSNEGTVLPERDRQDATPNADGKVSFLF
jgi:nucleolar protein 4